MQLFENTVKLRGFLGKDPEAASSDRIAADSFAVLLLATVSGSGISRPTSGIRALIGIVSSVLARPSAGWFAA